MGIGISTGNGITLGIAISKTIALVKVEELFIFMPAFFLCSPQWNNESYLVCLFHLETLVLQS